jgi:hypothetical protein
MCKGSSTDSLSIHEEMFNILCQKGNANQNYTEISSHPSQNGYYQENKTTKMPARMVE